VSHDYHQGREGAIIFDGCDECDERAVEPIKALLNLDRESFTQLRDRMLAVEYDGTDTYRSKNEARVGKHLYYIQVLQERHGVIAR
jgi:hypothetical protein